MREGGFATALGAFGSRARSNVDDGDNRHGSGVHEDEFLLVHEVPQSAPRRINLHQCRSNRDDANAGARNNRAYGDIEVNVTDPRSAVRIDDGFADARTLLIVELHIDAGVTL